MNSSQYREVNREKYKERRRDSAFLSIAPLTSYHVLPSGKLFFYTICMDSLSTGLILTVCTILIFTVVQKWWRHRQAAKLADKLLDDVIKGKDAFRR